jgi:hypothetical protein
VFSRQFSVTTATLLAPSKMFSLQGEEAYNMRWQTEGSKMGFGTLVQFPRKFSQS